MGQVSYNALSAPWASHQVRRLEAKQRRFTHVRSYPLLISQARWLASHHGIDMSTTSAMYHSRPL